MNHSNFSKTPLSQKKRLFSRHFLDRLHYDSEQNSPTSQTVSDDVFFYSPLPFQEKEECFEPYMDWPFFSPVTSFKEDKRRRFSPFKTSFYR